MRNFFDFLIYFFGGLPIIFAVDEDDPELWDNPRKKARIRRRMTRRGWLCKEENLEHLEEVGHEKAV
jgi:hypothetical protein